MGNSTSSSKKKDRSNDGIDGFIKNMKRLKSQVPEMVNLHYGLLDTLIGQGLLNSQQTIAIEEKQDHYSRVYQLMDDLISRITSNEMKEQFLNALNQTKHKHVSNYLQGDGRYTTAFVNDWPMVL